MTMKPISILTATDRQLSVCDLSLDQRLVYDQLFKWSLSPMGSVLTIGGYAGVGKTALVSVFAAETNLKIAYCCPTGRAASVLNRKLLACGVKTTNLLQAREGEDGEERPISGYSYSSLSSQADFPFCGTIHRLLYRPVVDEETEEIKGWVRRDRLDRGYDLIVIDEASMVGDELLADIRMHDVPILAVGDHGQLPPVMSRSSLMENPDLRLEKIHRQAEGSPIIALSKMMREKGRFDYDLEGEHIRFVAKKDMNLVLEEVYAACEPIDVGLLCWTNVNRIKMNAAARKVLGTSKAPPTQGEILLWLKNTAPVYNGMRGVLMEDTSPGDQPWHLNARIEFPEEKISALDYVLCSAQFNRPKTFGSVEELQERGINVNKMSAAGSFADFGYALTVHKSQGSAFKHVVFMADMPREKDEYRKFAYTAITRSSSKLTVLV